MTANTLIAIQSGLSELDRLPFPYKTARRLAALNRQIREEIAVINKMELALVEKYGGKVDRAYNVTFPDKEAGAAFAEARAELMDEDNDDITLPTVDLSKYVDVIELTPRAAEALEGVIIFEERDNGRQTDKQSTGSDKR